ncbi:MAG TPA: phosphoribosyltransferase [Candidatus Limnocylindrales bacterium]|jgi:predicted phosphoribosyltransferase
MFRDRRDAGRQLSTLLGRYASHHPVVVGLPRGGVPVAAEIARDLHAPLDIIVVRKLGVPWQPELGFGAIAEGNVCLVNEALVREAGLGQDEIVAIVAREQAELERRVRAYRGDRRPVPVDGREVIVVDDGLATGGTAHAAIDAMRRRGASRVVLAVPVAPADLVATMGRVADEFVAVRRPGWLLSIGEHYEDFTQTSDDEVRRLLDRAGPAGGHRSVMPSRR